jgi:thiosulfate/3-mercaptopyruvate sulfurtransferase
MPQAAASSPLISAAELAQLLVGEDPPTVLDVRWQLGAPPMRPEYLRGHIPGAVFVELESELSSAPARDGSGGRHPLPTADAFARSMRVAGVSNARGVVVYDAASAMAAARAWWLLRYFGHRRVAVLDGGLAAWMQAGCPVEREAPLVQAGDFEARPGGMPLIDADGAAELAARGVLLDARAAERFRGEREPVDPIAGHIPGAVNLPSDRNVDQSGRFLAPRELVEGFRRAGVGDDVAVGAYCGSGVVAAHEVLALELAGVRAALYGGSWSDWISDSRRPVARSALDSPDRR